MVELLETAKLLAEQYKLKGYMPSYVNLYTKWWASLTSGSTDYIIGNLIENRMDFLKSILWFSMLEKILALTNCHSELLQDGKENIIETLHILNPAETLIVLFYFNGFHLQ